MWNGVPDQTRTSLASATDRNSTCTSLSRLGCAVTTEGVPQVPAGLAQPGRYGRGQPPVQPALGLPYPHDLVARHPLRLPRPRLIPDPCPDGVVPGLRVAPRAVELARAGEQWRQAVGGHFTPGGRRNT